MKKHLLVLILAAVLGFAGCKKTKKAQKMSNDMSSEMYQEIDAATEDESLVSFFNELDEFAEMDEFALVEREDQNYDLENEAIETAQAIDYNQYEEDFWKEEETFKSVHFRYDQGMWDTTEEANVEYNINLAKALLEENEDITLVVEGHTDSIYRSAAYNQALSETRAKNLKDRFVAAGIPEDAIKVVGRADYYPVIQDGVEVAGSIEEQAPNRRSEVHTIYA